MKCFCRPKTGRRKLKPRRGTGTSVRRWADDYDDDHDVVELIAKHFLRMTEVAEKIKSRVYRSFFDLPKEESRQCLNMIDDAQPSSSEIDIAQTETSVDSDGAVSIWRKTKSGKISYFENRTTDGRLTLERFYHPNGNEKLAIGYHENGGMRFKSTYDERGVMTRQTLWTNAGLLTESNEYLNSYRHGLCVKYSEKTGRLISRVEFANDQFHGLSETYYTDPGAETLRERAWYRNGQNGGEYTKFFKNGKVEESGCIRDGKYIGSRTQNYESGKTKRISRYENGELNGPQEEFNESGVLVRVFNMKFGVLHGFEKTYSADGKLTYQSCYVDGKSNKNLALCEPRSVESEVVTLHFENGLVRSTTQYKNGLPDGGFQVFHIGGNVIEEGTFLSGKLSGRHRRFDLAGKIIEETHYLDGRRSGPRTRFFESGQIETIEDFEGDKLLGIRNYYENGQIRTSREWSNFDCSRVREYSDRGFLLSEIEYSSELRHGRELIYDELGILFSEGFFVYGSPSGTHRMFWNNSNVKLNSVFENGRLQELREFYRDGQPARVATFYPDGSIKNEEHFKDPGVQPDSAASAKTGDTIGEYKILRSLGHGGMGDVFLASDSALDRQVAIKTIRGNIDKESMARFLAEGRALARIRHHNVIQIFSNGNHFGTPYIVMEYLQGWPLNSLIGKGVLGIGEQLSIFRQMVAGVGAAHKEKILHRDLKPGNVLVGQRLQVKIIDFGIAKVLDDSRAGVTATGVAIGTVKYLAPEIAAGLPAVFQTDIYGLGIIFYEMLTGITPFQGSTREETLRRIQTEPLLFPDEIRTLIPEDLLQLVQKMTSKSVGDRPLNCDEVFTALGETKALQELRTAGLIEASDKVPGEHSQLLHVRNVDEVRKNLESRGCRPSEISLIINLACRIQIGLDSKDDRTVGIDHGSAVIVSTAAIDEATARIDRAKRSTK